MQEFLRTKLRGLELKAKLIREKGLLLGAEWVFPPRNAHKGTIRIGVQMDRIIQGLKQRGASMYRMKTHWQNRSRYWNHNLSRQICSTWAFVLLWALGPCYNIRELIAFVDRDLFVDMCRAICLLTRVSTVNVPRIFATQIGPYK
jgi:hypothetical protein